jgi:taurine dioxygenase
MPASQATITLTATRLAGALGAEVHGIDLSQVDATGAAAIKDLLVEQMVLFFPDQDLTMDQHVAFGRHFGHLEGHPNLANPYPDHPEVFELTASHGGVADEWHTDVTFLPQPALMSILRMVKCPPVGGDTMWTNLCQAYDELSAPLQELCDGLTALHNAEPHGKPESMAVHPVVRVHPVTGRKALYVNEHFTRRIVELSSAESDVLLRHLCAWVHEPRFTVRYRWSEGTVAMWDNRATQHFVLGDFDGERVIQRVTVMGDAPEGVGAPRWAPYRAGRTGATTYRDRALRAWLRREGRHTEG